MTGVANDALNVLFLCTGNSARSILAEAILDRNGAGRFRAFSAGSRPRGEVHPAALALLEQCGFSTTGLRSKSWEEFAGAGAPPLDLIITVCDNAAGESCPIWPGHPVTAHWGIEDPAEVEGEDRAQPFRSAFETLEQRIGLLVALPAEALDPGLLQARVRSIAAEAESTLG